MPVYPGALRLADKPPGTAVADFPEARFGAERNSPNLRRNGNYSLVTDILRLLRICYFGSGVASG